MQQAALIMQASENDYLSGQCKDVHNMSAFKAPVILSLLSKCVYRSEANFGE